MLEIIEAVQSATPFAKFMVVVFIASPVAIGALAWAADNIKGGRK